MKNNLLYLILGCLFLLPKTTFGCMNEYWGIVNGKLHVGDEKEKFNKIPMGNNLKDSHMGLLFDEMTERYRKKPTLENYSDYAAVLIYKGKYQQAKKILLEIEQKKANLYNTAANLGTVYELLGQNDSALAWIRKAVEINPQSHYSSEWIHVKILEEKVKAGNDAAYFYKNSVLGLNFGQDTIPQNNNKIDLKDYSDKLYYQLSERMSFIKPKDPIIAQLTFDLANLYMLQNRLREAFFTFDKAKEYGFDNKLFDGRFQLSKKLYQEKRNLALEEQINNLSKPKTDSPSTHNGLFKILLFITGILLFVLVFFFIWNKKR